MATAVQPPRPSKRGTQSLQSSANQRHDLFYGQEPIARTCHRFITHLFTCPDYPPTVAGAQNAQARLPYFIAYALHRTKLHQSVTVAALVLLQRLKARFPTAKGSSGHRLFISAFMIASKVICDDTYSNKSWSIVAQNIFSLREINQMEREMCSYLDWELNVDGVILANFQERLMVDFGQDQSQYPKYDVSLVSKRIRQGSVSSAGTPVSDTSSTTTAIQSYGSRNSTPVKSSSSSNQTYSPTPDTPSPSYSNSTSPTTSPGPLTPPSTEDYSAKIHGHDHSPRFTCVQELPPNHPLKPKMFAKAMGTGW